MNHDPDRSARGVGNYINVDRRETDLIVFAARGDREFRTPSCVLIAPDRANPCRLAPKTATDNEISRDEARAMDHRILKDAKPVIGALAIYAKGLARITDGKSRAELLAAGADIGASLGELSAAAGVPIPGKALGRALATGAAAALDQGRYDILKAAVADAEPAVMTLSAPIADVLEALRRLKMVELQAQYGALLNAHRSADRKGAEARLAAINERLEEVEALKAAQPALLAKTLVKSHSALNAALSSNTGQTEAVLATLEELSSVTKDLIEAF